MVYAWLGLNLTYLRSTVTSKTYVLNLKILNVCSTVLCPCIQMARKNV